MPYSFAGEPSSPIRHAISPDCERTGNQEEIMSDVPMKSVSRRKFLRGGAVAAGAAAGGLAMPAVVTAQSPQVIRMQSSWTSSDIFQ
jgi:hypothetical protein